MPIHVMWNVKTIVFGLCLSSIYIKFFHTYLLNRSLSCKTVPMHLFSRINYFEVRCALESVGYIKGIVKSRMN